jgi:hypothetical protein
VPRATDRVLGTPGGKPLFLAACLRSLNHSAVVLELSLEIPTLLIHGSHGSHFSQPDRRL